MRVCSNSSHCAEENAYTAKLFIQTKDTINHIQSLINNATIIM